MMKIKSLEELEILGREIRNKLNSEANPDGLTGRVHIKVAMATCGLAAGAGRVMEFFIEQLERRNVEGIVSKTGCMGYCYAEPTIEVTLPGVNPVVFGNVDLKKADEIIEKYIKSGEMVDGIIPVNYRTVGLKK